MGWPTAKIGEVLSVDRQSVEPQEIVNGTLYVGLENITGDGSFAEVEPIQNGTLSSSKFSFGDRHVLFGKLRPYLRKTAKPKFSGICSTDILPLLPSEKLDRGYLYHTLRLPTFVEAATLRATGVNLPRISPKLLTEMEIPLPALPEQRRIAAILDKADALRQKRREAIAKLDQLLQSVFLEMFGDPVTNPKRWPLTTLGDVADFENGDRSHKYPSGEDIQTEGVLFLSTKNIRKHHLDLSDAQYISEKKFESLSRGKTRRKDLLITLRGTLGACCIFDCMADTAFVNAQMMIVRPNQRVVPEFLHALITSDRIQALIKYGLTGGAVPQLTAKGLRQLPLYLPPVADQKKYAAAIDSVGLIRKKAIQQSSALESMFGAVQQRAFTGKL